MKTLASLVIASHSEAIDEKVPSSWSSYIGKTVRLTLKDGSESRGKLIKVGCNKKNQQSLVFSSSSGQKRYVPIKNIKTVKK
jgi:TPP-dependent 2-oxoacid decarboxylase